MVGLTVVAGALILTAGAGAPALAGIAAGNAVGGAVGGASVAGTVAASAGAGLAAGGVTGAAATGTVAAAAVGSATGAVAAAAVPSTGAGLSGLVTTGIAAGPVGWFCLGTDNSENVQITYDCWKPILHDESTVLSNGVILRDILADRRVRSFKVQNSDRFFPEITLENIWGEKFGIEYVSMPSNDICLHAVRI